MTGEFPAQGTSEAETRVVNHLYMMARDLSEGIEITEIFSAAEDCTGYKAVDGAHG